MTNGQNKCKCARKKRENKQNSYNEHKEDYCQHFFFLIGNIRIKSKISTEYQAIEKISISGAYYDRYKQNGRKKGKKNQ